MAKFQDSVEVVYSARNEATAELRKAEQEAKAASDREARRAKQLGDERAKVDRELRDAELRSRGQHVEADLDIIRRGHNKRIRAALDANDLELADRIATLRDLRIAEEKSARQRGALVRNVFENQFVGAAVKATAAFGILELGLGGVNAAAKALSGDIKDAAEAVKQLPAGIGPFARQLEEVLGTVTGITSEIEAIEAETRAMERANERQKQAQIDILEIERDRKQVQRDIRNEIELAMAAESDRSAITIRQREEDRLRAAREAVEAAERQVRAGGLSDADRKAIRDNALEREKLETTSFLESAGDTAFKQSLSLRAAAHFELIDTPAERRSRDEAAVVSIRNSNRQIRAQGEQRAQAELEAARERLTLEQQAIEVARQRRAEDERGAQAEEQRDQREREIMEERERLAREQRERDRQERQQEREDQRRELARIRQERDGIRGQIADLRDEQRDLGRLGQSTPQNTADQNRFLTGVSERSAEFDRRRVERERQTLRLMERQIEQLQQTDARLATMQDALRNGPRIVGGIFD